MSAVCAHLLTIARYACQGYYRSDYTGYRAYCSAFSWLFLLHEHALQEGELEVVLRYSLFLSQRKAALEQTIASENAKYQSRGIKIVLESYELNDIQHYYQVYYVLDQHIILCSY